MNEEVCSYRECAKQLSTVYARLRRYVFPLDLFQLPLQS